MKKVRKEKNWRVSTESLSRFELLDDNVIVAICSIFRLDGWLIKPTCTLPAAFKTSTILSEP